MKNKSPRSQNNQLNRSKSSLNLKKIILLLFRNILLTFLIISPVFIYIGVSYYNQLQSPTDKDPYVHWNGLDPHDSVYISWETKEHEASFVKYGLSPDTLNNVFINNSLVGIHHVILKGLTPNTKYFYQVGSGANNLISDIRSFTTAPNTKVEFNFTLISDTQQLLGTGHYDTIADALARGGDTSFVIDVGDLSQHEEDQADWNFFFEQTAKYSRNIPILPVLGNHDGDGCDVLYAKYFNVSQAPCNHYYAFNWSNAQFVIAELADIGDKDPTVPYNHEHDIWLNATLAAGAAMDYRILIFHRNLYSSNGNDWTNINRFMPIIKKYNVSLVFYGHQHIYERFFVDNHTLICLGSGGGLQNVKGYTYNYTQVIDMGASYTRVYVNEDFISIKTFSPIGNVIDSVNLSKKGNMLLPMEEN
ncbi:MAG: metallophosphoesterase [Promethearchaeota archaeon]